MGPSGGRANCRGAGEPAAPVGGRALMRTVLCCAAVETTSELRERVRRGLWRLAPLLPDTGVTARVALRREGPLLSADVTVPAGHTVLRGHGRAAHADAAVDEALAEVERACHDPRPESPVGAAGAGHRAG